MTTTRHEDARDGLWVKRDRELAELREQEAEAQLLALATSERMSRRRV